MCRRIDKSLQHLRYNPLIRIIVNANSSSNSQQIMRPQKMFSLHPKRTAYRTTEKVKVGKDGTCSQLRLAKISVESIKPIQLCNLLFLGTPHLGNPGLPCKWKLMNALLSSGMYLYSRFLPADSFNSCIGTDCYVCCY